jgi:CheY-like chemotaxis protein
MENDLLRGKKILIVEDDFASRLYLNKILEIKGVILFNAVDGQEAVNTVDENPDLDLILMDIQLPVMDGYSAVRKIREIRKDIIIIAQTAFGMLGEKEKILDSGFDDYMVKPILSDALLKMLNAYLTGKKHTRKH